LPSLELGMPATAGEVHASIARDCLLTGQTRKKIRDVLLFRYEAR